MTDSDKIDECKNNTEHILTNDKQGMYICKKCGKSLESEIQEEKEMHQIINKNIQLFNELRNKHTVTDNQKPLTKTCMSCGTTIMSNAACPECCLMG